MSHFPSNLPPIDAWVASSLMQKAIRRGDAFHAQEAAAVFHRLRGAAIWRRLILIAHEDVGVGDLELCVHATRCGTDRLFRNSIASDQEIIADLIDRLCRAPKNRESDYLICAAKQAPFTEATRASVASYTTDIQMEIATDPRSPLLDRATAVWMASGVNGGGPQVLSLGDLRGLMGAFEQAGLHHSLRSSLEAASEKTREPIVMMVPLIWTVLHQKGEKLQLVHDEMPSSVLCSGIPAYAFDKHTQLGKQAVRILLNENRQVRELIGEFVPEFRALDVANMGAFYADAICVRTRASWSQSASLYDLGLRTDFTKIGTPESGVVPIANAMHSALEHLNDIRGRLRNALQRRRGRVRQNGELSL